MFEDSTVATFRTQQAAEEAVLKLVANGVQMRRLSIATRGFYTEHQAVGFYTRRDRALRWALWGALWGWLFGLMFGPLFLAMPMLGLLPGVTALPATAPVINPLGWFIGSLLDAIAIGVVCAIVGALAPVSEADARRIRYIETEGAEEYRLLMRGTPDDLRRARDLLAQETTVAR